MIDLLHLPEPDERTVWFPGQGESTNLTGWRVWTKPRGVSMVSILAIGSGGGGGAGFGAASGSTAGGGGGGAAGPIVRCLWLASMLPERLYVLTTSGGTGGTPGFSGTSGGPSCVAIFPSIAVTNNNAIVRTGAAPNGANGSSSSGGQGNQASVAGISLSPLAQMAVSASDYLPASSGAGSTGSIAAATPDFILGGRGGGGKTTGAGGTGGGYSAATQTLISLVAGGTAETGADASSGFIHAGVYFGGCGGGGNNLGVGGRGGNGVAWGAGGGGGGGGLIGGNGGDGGPGLVIIASW